MRRFVLLAAFVAVSLGSAGCRSRFVESNLSAPAVTGPPGGEVVWWAEHRASERGDNDTRVIICRYAADPPCIRTRVRDVE
jgi:hypothetical protein